MLMCMGEAIEIDAELLKQLRRQAETQGVEVRYHIETMLRSSLQSESMADAQSLAFETFDSGGHLVDISDRQQLYSALND